jgi:CheY-like chemotaxis protein
LGSLSALGQSFLPRRVLIVEDDLLAARTLQAVLVADGHTVEIAQDGEQGLAMFKAGGHNLVITDFKLTRMDGLELAEAIKGDSPATPVILITAYTEAIKGSMGKVSNIEHVLRKPFSAAQLREALSKILTAT